MDEGIQVSYIIEKLPYSLKDFKHTLKHLKEELTLVELGSICALRSPSGYNNNKGKRKHHDKTRTDPIKKAKPTCWNCGKTGHIKRDCKGVNVGNKASGSGTKGSLDGSSNSLKGQNMFNKSLQVYYVTYVSEAYVVQDDNVTWWVDSEATIYVCKDRCWFKTYESLNDGSILHIENESTALVHGRGCVDLRFSSGKIVSLFNVLHVPNIRKNLKEAINDEMDSIMGNNTWVLADLPPHCKPIGCKWIFKRKLKVDETIKKFKARLVIQSLKQKSRIDYFNTYALVARISTIRLLIALASIYNLINHQMDVKTTFLNGELDEEVYMNQPQGFIMPSNENKVDLTKELLSSSFSMKDMGEADVILVSTHMDTSEKLMPNNGQAVSQPEYSRVIGCLMYATTCTSPEIDFAMGKLAGIVVILVLSTDNSSASGWVFLLGGGEISWASKKQTCITGLIMEYEFVTLAVVSMEAK
nr:zinc finger, CCHC-type [Tanacetum cinerariifolium]